MKIFNWLFGARGEAQIKDLSRRRFTMGAQIGVTGFAYFGIAVPDGSAVKEY